MPIPIAIYIGLSLPQINKPEIPRWNLQKAKWAEYTKYMEDNINRIPPIPDNYLRFVKLIKKAALIVIPRGYRQNYISCWNKDCKLLLHEYEQTRNEVTANRLMALLGKESRNRWISAIEKISYTHLSRKSSGLLRTLGAAHRSSKFACVAASKISRLTTFYLKRLT